MNARVFRITVANILAGEIAQAGQRAGLAGTVASTGVGFGEWGIEPSVTFEIAETTFNSVKPFVTTLLKLHNESAAYVTINGTQPQLWWVDGREELLVVETPHSRPLVSPPVLGAPYGEVVVQQ